MDAIITEAKFPDLNPEEIVDRMLEMHKKSGVAVIGVTPVIAKHLHNQGAVVTYCTSPEDQQRPGSLENPIGSQSWKYGLSYEGRKFRVSHPEKIQQFHQ